MFCKIVKIACYLPEKVVTNADLEKEFTEWSAGKIETKVGIRERHVAAPEETALDMAVIAGKRVLDGYDKARIDFVLLCTQSPDYFLPTSACLLQDRLGLGTNCGALDFNLGCSGFVYGLAIAKGLIATGVAHNVLLITSETYNKHIHPLDKGNRSIFGDGAAATLIEPAENDGVRQFVLGTDGAGFENLIIRNGAMRHPGKQPEIVPSEEIGYFYTPDFLSMNGSEIFNFTIDKIPGLVEDVLKANALALDEVDYFIFHQANKFILEYLRDMINIPVEKFYLNMLLTGNTVSATLPIALADCFATGKLKQGDKVMLVGFGVGLSWGGCIIEIA